MYRSSGVDGRGVVVVSPSDLLSFLSCRHKTRLDLEVAAGSRDRPTRDDPTTALLARRGLEHEGRYLEHLRAQGLEVENIDSGPPAPPDPAQPVGPIEPPAQVDDLRRNADRTRAAIESGVDVVFQ